MLADFGIALYSWFTVNSGLLVGCVFALFVLIWITRIVALTGLCLGAGLFLGGDLLFGLVLMLVLIVCCVLWLLMFLVCRLDYGLLLLLFVVLFDCCGFILVIWVGV